MIHVMIIFIIFGLSIPRFVVRLLPIFEWSCFGSKLAIVFQLIPWLKFARCKRHVRDDLNDIENDCDTEDDSP